MPATIPRAPHEPFAGPDAAGLTNGRTDRAAGPPVPRRSGLLRHLAGASLETARSRGVRCALQQAFGMESLLREFRVHLLATPVAARGDSYHASLTMIELMIAREALARPRSQAAARCDRRPSRRSCSSL